MGCNVALVLTLDRQSGELLCFSVWPFSLVLASGQKHKRANSRAQGGKKERNPHREKRRIELLTSSGRKFTAVVACPLLFTFEMVDDNEQEQR